MEQEDRKGGRRKTSTFGPSDLPAASFERRLGTGAIDPRQSYPLVVKLGAMVAALAALGLLMSRIDLTHDLRRLDVTVLSGDPRGHYHEVVAQIAQRAASRRGMVREATSSGSVENLRRLAASAKTCLVHFALVQDGTEGTLSAGDLATLAVYGRFARREAVLFVGKDADRLHDFAELKGLRIGVGPAGSGTALIAEQLFALPEFAQLGVHTNALPLEVQMSKLLEGDLDLGVFVMQDDTPLIVDAVRDRGLQIAGFARTAGVARRLPHLQTGRIYAGIYDAVRGLPPTDKEVMRVETLLLGNGCASRTQTVDLLSVLAQQFPEFVQHNKDTANLTSLPISPVAQEFYDNGGPQTADLYVPWLVDVMPPANWAYVVMGVSLLFNAMGAGHRFRLWRIDAARVHLEGRLLELFGRTTTLGDIERLSPASDARYGDSAVQEGVRGLIGQFEKLAARSRRQSLSVIVPMGQEMAYRYQEGVIYETLTVLRGFLTRAGRP